MTEPVQGSALPQENSVPTEKTTDNDKVSYETYKKVLAEAKKLKEANRALSEEKESAMQATLKEQQQWKQLYEQTQSKLQENEKTLTEQSEAIIRGLKYQEFEKHLGGKLRDQEYISHVPFDRIVVNPETKQVDEDSVKAVASEFTKKHPHLVEFTSAKLPNMAPKEFKQGVDFNDLKSRQDIKNAMAAVLSKK